MRPRIEGIDDYLFNGGKVFIGHAPCRRGGQRIGVSLPGRPGRATEPPMTDLDTLVRALLAETEFAPLYDPLGHSHEALIAFEVARALTARGLPLPERLIASACPPRIFRDRKAAFRTCRTES
ncbi:thioesterase domain-containing protein [Actinacidiphila glaucinigra]|uniref:thioesterase II family protein n=1 Tax=Actinacidiphila glaucinigra TaxID=235986 RepID=UPI003245C52F